MHSSLPPSLLGLLFLLGACRKDPPAPDPYAAVQGDWSYAYSSYEEYDGADHLASRSGSGHAWWGPLTMHVGETEVLNYQTYSLRVTKPLPYRREQHVLTFTFPAGFSNTYTAPTSPRAVVGVPGDSLVLRWRTPAAVAGNPAPYRVVVDHFGRK